jgi:pimeloyl-ACP methyl ester carboxylesterase
MLADADDVVPIEHGHALARAWGGPASVLTLQGGHRSVEWRPEYWRAIEEFLIALGAGKAPYLRLERSGTRQK